MWNYRSGGVFLYVGVNGLDRKKNIRNGYEVYELYEEEKKKPSSSLRVCVFMASFNAQRRVVYVFPTTLW